MGECTRNRHAVWNSLRYKAAKTQIGHTISSLQDIDILPTVIAGASG